MGVAMKRFFTVLTLILAFLFFVAFPGLSTLFATSQVREDLINYCQATSPLVEREVQMYDLYESGDSDLINKKAQMAVSGLMKEEPKTEEVRQLHKKYLVIWDDWANGNVADLFGYGREDNELIRYHEDLLKLANKVGAPSENLDKYSRSEWAAEKKIITEMSKKYLLGTD